MPAIPDTEKSFDELKARLAKTIDYVKSFKPAQFEGADSRDVTFPAGPDKTMTLKGQQFLSHYSLPNFYFHAATAHDILRHNGVEIGKRDFLGVSLRGHLRRHSSHEATDGPSSCERGQTAAPQDDEQRKPPMSATTMRRSNRSLASPDRALTVPFGRQGNGWEVAYAALLLISNELSYVNAHTLFLDAGHMAGVVRG